MPRLLELDPDRGPVFVEDGWTLRREATGERPDGPVLLPLADWDALRDALPADVPVGVWLAPQEEVETIAGDLARLSVIALDFPVFSDGRGLSSAVLLRTRFGYRGELRAIGDVARDQLHYMRRCGFDAFAIGPGRDPEAAAAGLAVMSGHYQGDVLDARPAFRRGLRGTA